MRHVVAVAEVDERATGEAPLHLLDRQQIGEALAWVLEVRQRVHHRHAGGASEHFQTLLLERPQDDRIDVPGEDATGILDRLAPP